MEKKLVERFTSNFMDKHKGLNNITARVGNPQELFGNNAEKIGHFQAAFFPKSKIVALNNEGIKTLDGLEKSIRHELIGHAGINTFTPEDKAKLLVAISGTKDKDITVIRESLKETYPKLNEQRLAEEVFATISEVDYKDTVRLEKGISAENLDLDSLKSVSRYVSNGLKNGSLEQQTFPASDTAQFQKEPFYQTVANKVIEQLEKGTAPWQKPWEEGHREAPMNPTTGNQYKGMNAVFLAMQGRSDPRWLTYKQAQGLDAQVKKGEKATSIQYVKLKEEKVIYENGKPKVNSNGEKMKRVIVLEKPKYFSASVFNAEQIEGLPKLEKKETTREDLKKAEDILKNSGATINHDQTNSAFYKPSSDTIHLPEKSQFDSPQKYYATALHELGHWTGHKERLDRDLSGGKDSESYAKEELRAELGSLMLGSSLKISHDPEQHISYVKSWVKALKDEPKEILYAAKDADKIHNFVMEFDKDKSIETTENLAKKAVMLSKKSIAEEKKGNIELSEQLNSDAAFIAETMSTKSSDKNPFNEKDEPMLHRQFNKSAVSMKISELEKTALEQEKLAMKIEAANRIVEDKILSKEMDGLRLSGSSQINENLKEMANRFQTPEEQARFIEAVDQKIAEQEQQVFVKEQSNITQDNDYER